MKYHEATTISGALDDKPKWFVKVRANDDDHIFTCGTRQAADALTRAINKAEYYEYNRIEDEEPELTPAEKANVTAQLTLCRLALHQVLTAAENMMYADGSTLNTDECARVINEAHSYLESVWGTRPTSIPRPIGENW